MLVKLASSVSIMNRPAPVQPPMSLSNAFVHRDGIQRLDVRVFVTTPRAGNRRLEPRDRPGKDGKTAASGGLDPPADLLERAMAECEPGPMSGAHGAWRAGPAQRADRPALGSESSGPLSARAGPGSRSACQWGPKPEGPMWRKRPAAAARGCQWASASAPAASGRGVARGKPEMRPGSHPAPRHSGWPARCALGPSSSKDAVSRRPPAFSSHRAPTDRAARQQARRSAHTAGRGGNGR